MIYNLACGNGSLVATSDKVSRVQFSVGKDTASTIGDGSNVYNSIICDPIYLQSLSYNFAVDGDFTEEVGFIGLSKVAGSSGVLSPAAGNADRQTVLRRQILRLQTLHSYLVVLVMVLIIVVLLVLTLVVNLCTN